MQRHVGWQAAELAWWQGLHEDPHATTQVLAKLVWKPRRCLPSWLGWQLHVNSGGDTVGAGLVVAPLSPSARVLLGVPARVSPWRAGFPGKDLAGGPVGFFGEDGCLPILF